VSLPTAVVVSVAGMVEKLASEGASDQEILKAIRKKSPDIADVVEAHATSAARGWTFYQWVMVILMLISVALQARPVESPPSAEEIAQIVEQAVSTLPVLSDSGDATQEPKPSGGQSKTQ
jgi:hypothetical protein